MKQTNLNAEQALRLKEALDHVYESFTGMTPKQVTLNKYQTECLKEVLDYIYELEAEHFEVHCADDGKKEDHIYWKALQVEEALHRHITVEVRRAPVGATSRPSVTIPKEHDVVYLLCDYAGIPKGAKGTVVSVYSPMEEEVDVEFDNGNVVAVLSRHLEIIWTQK